MKLRDVVLLAASLTCGGIAAVRIVYTMVWGAPPSGGPHALALAVLAGIGAHELVHALAFLAVGVRWSDIRFSGSLRRGLLCVGYGSAVSAGAYRLVTLAPGILLGLFPLVGGVAIGWYTPRSSARRCWVRREAISAFFGLCGTYRRACSSARTLRTPSCSWSISEVRRAEDEGRAAPGAAVRRVVLRSALGLEETAGR